jgi:sulfane dehydrogenase subunit SoxC
VQPDRQSVITEMGTNAVFHYNGQQTWLIGADGMVRNVLA